MTDPTTTSNAIQLTIAIITGIDWCSCYYFYPNLQGYKTTHQQT